MSNLHAFHSHFPSPSCCPSSRPSCRRAHSVPVARHRARPVPRQDRRGLQSPLSSPIPHARRSPPRSMYTVTPLLFFCSLAYLYLTRCLAFGRGQPLSFCYNPKRDYDTYGKTLSVCSKTSPRKRSRVSLRGKEPAMASYAPPSPSLPAPSSPPVRCSYAEGSTQSPRPNQTPSSDSDFYR